MVGRRSGVSGKQKKAELMAKREKAREKASSDSSHAQPRGASAPPSGSTTLLQQPPRRFIQQVSKKGATNALSTQFVREDDAVVQARRLDGGRPLALELRERPLASAAPSSSVGMPLRPAWSAGEAASAQDARERAAFREWEEGVHARFADSELSPFEHNVEVWRQLWRVLERCDVLCIIADARNPLLHIPAALYAHLADERQVRTVIVLTKVDLVSEAHLASWTAELRRRFAKAHLATFSSKGRAVGGSVGGGVAARRRQLAAPLSAAQRAAVRAYVEEIATACAVTLPAAGGVTAHAVAISST